MAGCYYKIVTKLLWNGYCVATACLSRFYNPYLNRFVLLVLFTFLVWCCGTIVASVHNYVHMCPPSPSSLCRQISHHTFVLSNDQLTTVIIDGNGKSQSFSHYKIVRTVECYISYLICCWSFSNNNNNNNNIKWMYWILVLETSLLQRVCLSVCLRVCVLISCIWFCLS